MWPMVIVFLLLSITDSQVDALLIFLLLTNVSHVTDWDYSCVSFVPQHTGPHSI